MSTTTPNMKSKEPPKKSAVLVRYFREHSIESQNFVKASFSSEKIRHVRLREALEHYFSYWNDFTHPGFFSLAFEASGGNLADSVKPQAAMAMIAAALDIHDDIIDRSRRKNGYVTVFGKFGEDVSILLGNAFLVKGLTLLGDSASKLTGDKQREIFKVAKDCLFEVGNAHALELEMKGRRDVSPEKYMQVLEMKAAGVEADMHIATLMAGASDRCIKILKEYGRIIGTLAILREEFVDMFEHEELNRRIQKETLPIPLMYALKSPRSKGKILELLKKRKIGKEDVTALTSIVMDTEPMVKLKKKMQMLCRKGIILISNISNRKSQLLLVNLTKSMLEDI
jgi:geranylgeranyl pyrophosphate synthase